MDKTPQRAAALGCPSYVWRSGQERRLSLIRRHVSLEGARILDIGCGIGAYVRRLRDLSPRIYGVDVDEQRIRRGSESLPNLMLAVGEHLPFRDDTFDAVLLNEVIEHVTRRRGDDSRGLPRRQSRVGASSSSRRTASTLSKRTASTSARGTSSATYRSSTICRTSSDDAWRRTFALTPRATSIDSQRIWT